MRKFNLFLVCGILTAMFFATGCNNNEPERPAVPDPPGTVRLLMRDVYNGNTWITPDYFTGSIGMRNENFVWQAWGTSIQFASVGEVRGLGEITEIPTSGWANQVAIVPGHGYIARQNSNHIRMYVVDWIVGLMGEIIGAEIQFQSPFESTEPEANMLVFETEGGNRNITVFSNENWTITRTDNANWYTVYPLSGERNATVAITITEQSLEQRETTLIFNSGGIEFATAVIRQESGVPFIQLDRNTLNFGRGGGTQNITVSSNDSWTISGGADWLTVSPQSGTRNTAITVTATQNGIAEAREATLTFSSETQTATVTITQEAALPVIQLNRNTLNFNSVGGNQTVTVSSNGNWTVSGGADWLTVSPQSGTGNVTVTISATANPIILSRTSVLTFRHGTLTATLNITQEARPFDDNPQGLVINGVRWATRNVGTPGAFAASPEAPGMFYQWNRRTGWSATGSVSGWNSNPSTTVNWARANDPCPSGWRVPTIAEINTLGDTNNVGIGLWTSANGTYGLIVIDNNNGNIIFLPAVGWRNVANGALNDAGFVGRYWSGTSTDGGAFHLLFNAQEIATVAWNRGNGFSVRCVAE